MGVVEENVRRVDVGDHHQPAPPLERGLEQVGQLAVAVLHVAGALPQNQHRRRNMWLKCEYGI